MIGRSPFRRMAAIAAAVAVFHPGAPVQAQTARADQDRVEVVVVTAERREENLQQAPVAASVLTEESLRQHSITTVDDLEFATPSLTVASNGQSNQMNIRGIGKEDNSGTATSAVATYRDGVGSVSGFFNGEPYYDIASIEVLRGPQGTFVGENAAGGAIFVNTRDPEVGGAFDGFVEAGAANYSERSVMGALNIPLTQTLAGRVAFDHQERDSYFDVFMDQAMTVRNPGNVGDVDHDSVRVGLLWQPSERFEAKIKYDYNDLDNHGYAFGVVPGWPSPTGFVPDAMNISSDPFTVGNNSTDNYAKDRISRGVLDMHYAFGNGLILRSVSGMQDIDSYIRNDDDGSVFMDRRQHIRAQFRVYTQELSLVSPAENRFSWITGAFWREETLDFPRNDGFILTDGTHYVPGVQVQEITLIWHTPRTTAAVFGQGSYKLTDALQLDLGVRYNYFHVSEEVDLQLPVFGIVLPDFARYSEDSWSGKVALNWQASEDHYFYAFIATGNTTGGVSVVASNPDFQNQTTIDYELGWKGQLFDQRLFTQIGGFYDSIDDYQAYFVDATTGIGTFQNLGGTSKVYGLEATAQAVLGNLAVDVGAAWIDSELGSSLVFDDVLGAPVDTGGNEQPYTPMATFHGGLEYALRLGGDFTLTPRVDYAHISHQTTSPLDRFTPDGVRIDRVFAHDLLNLKLTLETGKWLVTAYMDNVTDEQYIEAHGGPGYNAYPNAPRSYGLRASFTF